MSECLPPDAVRLVRVVVARTSTDPRMVMVGDEESVAATAAQYSEPSAAFDDLEAIGGRCEEISFDKDGSP